MKVKVMTRTETLCGSSAQLSCALIDSAVIRPISVFRRWILSCNHRICAQIEAWLASLIGPFSFPTSPEQARFSGYFMILSCPRSGWSLIRFAHWPFFISDFAGASSARRNEKSPVAFATRLYHLVTPTGFKPVTLRAEIWYSIQLNHGANKVVPRWN